MNWLIERLGRLGATALLVAVAMGLIWWGYSTFVGGSRAKVEARLNKEQAEAAIASGTDALETVDAQGETEAYRDAQVKELEKELNDAETSSDAHATGAGWLCVNFNICDKD